MNINIIWTGAFVDELYKLGVRYAVTGIGSRSTPLIYTLELHPSIKAFPILDERSAAFFALGLAKQTRKPVVLVSTSGTAAANFLPAIIEANKSNNPLIVCTSDRPVKLRDTGANQTIDQVKMFQNYVHWFVDIAQPSDEGAGTAYIRSIASKAFLRSSTDLMGPVHLNFPFSKPLEPDEQISKFEKLRLNKDFKHPRLNNNEAFMQVFVGKLQLEISQLSWIKQKLDTSKRPIIIVGPDTKKDLKSLVLQFAKQFNLLIFADGLSPLRYGVKQKGDLITGYETFLQADLDIKSPDFVIQIGKTPTSKFLLEYLDHKHSITKIIISEGNEIADPSLNLAGYIKTEPSTALKMLLDLNTKNFVRDRQWQHTIKAIERQTWRIINEQLELYPEFEPNLVKQLLSTIDEGSNVFISNSLPVRHVDQFVESIPNDLNLYFNRGASGIDGIISTAGGIAHSSQSPTYLITGDLAFLHDINGLLALEKSKTKLVIIIINNQGGAIFQRLPISKHDRIFNDYFVADQNIKFDELEKVYQIDYYRINENLSDLLAKVTNNTKSVILEFKVKNETVERIRSVITKKIISELSPE